MSPGALEPVFRGGFCRWNLVQRGKETLTAGALGHLPHAGPAGKLFGQGGRNDPFHGNLLPRCQIGNLAVHRVGNRHVESHGASHYCKELTPPTPAPKAVPPRKSAPAP